MTTHRYFIHQKHSDPSVFPSHDVPPNKINDQEPSRCLTKYHLNVLPAVACNCSREKKQQIKTVPFMMAARRTVIVTQTIYTKAGRLKGTQREEAAHREGRRWRG